MSCYVLSFKPSVHHKSLPLKRHSRGISRAKLKPMLSGFFATLTRKIKPGTDQASTIHNPHM